MKITQFTKILNKSFNNTFVLFICIGAISTLTDWGLFYLFERVAFIYYIWSAVFSALIAGTLNFFLNKYVNFKSKNRFLMQYVSFMISLLAYSSLTSLLMFFFVENWNMDSLVSKIFTTFILTIINYAYQKTITFGILARDNIERKRIIKRTENNNRMSLFDRMWTWYQEWSPSYYWFLNKELKNCKTVIEFGCGENSPVRYFKGFTSVGVEVYSSAIKKAREAKTHTEFVEADVLAYEPSKKFDCAVALDLIEHLKKTDGLIFLEKLERCADKVIIFTPNGFLPQDKEEIKNNPWQKHLSGWTVNEFKKRGYKVYGINGPKCLRKELAQIRFKPRFFWFAIAELAQWVTWMFPNSAFQLFAVRKIKKPQK